MFLDGECPSINRNVFTSMTESRKREREMRTTPIRLSAAMASAARHTIGSPFVPCLQLGTNFLESRNEREPNR